VFDGITLDLTLGDRFGIEVIRGLADAGCQTPTERIGSVIKPRGDSESASRWRSPRMTMPGTIRLPHHCFK
jgi:hypothetical protein